MHQTRLRVLVTLVLDCRHLMKILIVLLLILSVSCSTLKKPQSAIMKTSVGITESELFKIMGPHSLDSGIEYLGGSGARIVYFHIAENKQLTS